MNTETGEIYRTEEDIRAALKRREPLVEVSATVAALMERARANRDTLDRLKGKRLRFRRPQDKRQ